jgi:NADH-quinone oxidoreductase subunit A
MGEFELILVVLSVILLAVAVFTIINILTFKDLIRRFGLLKATRRDFYECGFKPQKQQVIKISIQFIIICIFFLLYDIELVFLFPFVSGFSFTGLYDLLLMVVFFSILFISLVVDYERNALVWQE